MISKSTNELILLVYEKTISTKKVKQSLLCAIFGESENKVFLYPQADYRIDEW